MDAIQQSGWVGWVWFVALYVMSCVLFLPGSVLTVGAGAVYGGGWGTLLVAVASTAGSVVNFVTSRYLARGWVERRMVRSDRMKSLGRAIEREGWKLIFLSRLSPLVPHSVVSYAAGLTRISLWKYSLASFVGFLPISAAYAFAGALLGNLARAKAGTIQEEWSWAVSILSVLITLVISWLCVKVSSRALRADHDQSVGGLPAK
jgi:uncharacterized membrane protein YdjX (TVP38/TMEM64 family)